MSEQNQTDDPQAAPDEDVAETEAHRLAARNEDVPETEAHRINMRNEDVAETEE
jgi:hypothetical protein